MKIRIITTGFMLLGVFTLTGCKQQQIQPNANKSRNDQPIAEQNEMLNQKVTQPQINQNKESEATTTNTPTSPTGSIVPNNTKEAEKTYNSDMYGFFFNYPSEYLFNKSKYGIESITDNNKTFIINISFSREIAKNISEKKSLKLEDGRMAFPLVDEKYLTLNNKLFYRVLRQLKKGTELPEFINATNKVEQTETEVQYTFRINDDLIYLRLSIKSESPEKMISEFDNIVSNINFKK
jgi:hypothetical protein